jgi:hypothetical protein
MRKSFGYLGIKRFVKSGKESIFDRICKRSGQGRVRKFFIDYTPQISFKKYTKGMFSKDCKCCKHLDICGGNYDDCFFEE